MRSATTRFLLTCAALGVIGGLLAQAARLAGFTMAVAVPPLSYPAILPWFLGPVIAAALLRMPGAAMVTAVIAGLVGFSPLNLIIAGALIELPFLLSRYRNWNPGLYYLGGAVLALVNGVMLYLYIDFAAFPWWVQAGAIVVRVVVYLFYVWVALVLARALARIGVARPADAAQSPSRGE